MSYNSISTLLSSQKEFQQPERDRIFSLDKTSSLFAAKPQLMAQFDPATGTVAIGGLLVLVTFGFLAFNKMSDPKEVGQAVMRLQRSTGRFTAERYNELKGLATKLYVQALKDGKSPTEAQKFVQGRLKGVIEAPPKPTVQPPAVSRVVPFRRKQTQPPDAQRGKKDGDGAPTCEMDVKLDYKTTSAKPSQSFNVKVLVEGKQNGSRMKPVETYLHIVIDQIPVVGRGRSLFARV